MDYKPRIRTVLYSPIQTSVSLGTQPRYSGVGFDAPRYLARTPTYKIVKKFFHKYLVLLLKRQLALLTPTIRPEARVLLLYTGKDSFGDANLELSGRSLLKGKGVQLDLLTLPKLKPQFEEDDIFGHVFTALDQVDNRNYDAILISEFSHRSLKLKTRHFARHPFSCLFGFFDGPSRNQSQFSFAAFNDIFQLGFSAAELSKRAKPYLHCASQTLQSVSALLPPSPYIAISVGGIDPYRTYSHWAQVLSMLDVPHAVAGIREVALIGGDNGRNDANRLQQLPLKHITVKNMVGKLSLMQTRAVIVRASVFVGCDGGLMHVAHSTTTPTITIFSNKEPYEYWITPACVTVPIQSTGSASQIEPRQLIEAIHRKLANHQALSSQNFQQQS